MQCGDKMIEISVSFRFNKNTHLTDNCNSTVNYLSNEIMIKAFPWL